MAVQPVADLFDVVNMGPDVLIGVVDECVPALEVESDVEVICVDSQEHG